MCNKTTIYVCMMLYYDQLWEGIVWMLNENVKSVSTQTIKRAQLVAGTRTRWRWISAASV